MNDHDPSLEDLSTGPRPTRRRLSATCSPAAGVVPTVAPRRAASRRWPWWRPLPPAPPSSEAAQTPIPSRPPRPPPPTGTPTRSLARIGCPRMGCVGVPPLTLMLANRMVVMAPWSYCYGNACIDGMRPEGLDHVGSPDVVRFSFPEPGWTFEVTFKESGDECGRSITVPAESTDDDTFEVPAAGPAGDWEVDLFGRGPGGDVTTRSAGPHRPSARCRSRGYLGLISVSGNKTHIYDGRSCPSTTWPARPRTPRP